jgi:RsiW-degrading membrane proteinase PrsW (M82 family)
VPYWVKRGKYFTSVDFVNYWDTIISADLAGVNLAGFSAAFIILCLWLYFLRKMDIYEPEKWHHLVLTFLLSIVCMHLLYPAHDILWNVFDYYRPTRPVSDFAYITISVGMVEEFVKILPVLIM